MKIELLIDGPDFWSRLKSDLRGASKSAYIQTFSFEGDRVGVALGRAMEKCQAPDRRLLVDSYSLLSQNDRIIPGPAWFDRAFRREVMLTHRWVRRLRRGGVGVRFGNPIGPSPVKLVRRNHKKIVVVDERITYLGGINFSEHNFAWHDMMFRVEDLGLGRLISADFRASYEGRPQAYDRMVGPFRVISLNGRGNARRLEPIFETIAAARRSIDVASPYLSYPFTDHLAAARRRGVAVRVLTSEQNNKPNLARHIVQTAHREGFDVFLHGGMSHLKAMLIDDAVLIVGSCNFDFMGHYLLEELLVMTRNRIMIEAFVEQVWAPDFRSASRASIRPSTSTRLGHAAVLLGAAVASRLARPEPLPSNRALPFHPTSTEKSAQEKPGQAAGALPHEQPQKEEGGAMKKMVLGMTLMLIAVSSTLSAQVTVPITTEERPAWAVDGVPDSVWMLVEASSEADEEDRMKDLLRQAENHARAGIEGNAEDVGRRFALAVVLGLRTEIEGGRTKVNTASELHRELEAILEVDSQHARARHMLGRLHAGVRRMGRITRWIATNVLGGGELKKATWETAEVHLRFAEQQVPEVSDHHLQLANLYRDTDRAELGLQEVEHVFQLSAVSPMERAVWDEALDVKADLEQRIAREPLNK